jgi:cellulose synthase/poly-beta-1,6-N-acetylglucosamine synthase-like glycosyltransferase
MHVAVRSYSAFLAAYFCLCVLFISWTSPLSSGLFLFSELLLGLWPILLHFLCSRYRSRSSRPPSPGRTVDVFIATINEPTAFLRQTIRHCLRMRYPHRTIVLDDGDRREIRDLCTELGAEYLARGKPEGAKAGNLNHALDRTDGELVAFFDADGVPTLDFLEKTIGYFDDSSIALVQAQPFYYNVDGFPWARNFRKSRLWNDEALLYQVLAFARDAWSVKNWNGSGAILRRSALREIGGIAPGTAEDFHTSLKLFAAGYQGIYHPEQLYRALTPWTLRAYVHQRVRWMSGMLDAYFNTTGRNRLLPAITVLLVSSDTFLGGLPLLASFAVPLLLCLNKGGDLAHFPVWLAALIPAAHFLREGLSKKVTRDRESGREAPVFRALRSFLYAYTLVSWITRRLFRRELGFRVTPKDGASAETAGFTRWAFSVLPITLFGALIWASLLLWQNPWNTGLWTAAALAAISLSQFAGGLSFWKPKGFVHAAISMPSELDAKISVDGGPLVPTKVVLLSDREWWILTDAHVPPASPVMLRTLLARVPCSMRAVALSSAPARTGSPEQLLCRQAHGNVVKLELAALSATERDLLWDQIFDVECDRLSKEGQATGSQEWPLVFAPT